MKKINLSTLKVKSFKIQDSIKIKGGIATQYADSCFAGVAICQVK